MFMEERAQEATSLQKEELDLLDVIDDFIHSLSDLQLPSLLLENQQLISGLCSAKLLQPAPGEIKLV